MGREHAIQPKVFLKSRKQINAGRQGQKLVLVFNNRKRRREGYLPDFLDTDRLSTQHVHKLHQRAMHFGEQHGRRLVPQDLETGAGLQGEKGFRGVRIALRDLFSSLNPGQHPLGADFFIRTGQGPKEPSNPGRKNPGEFGNPLQYGQLLVRRQALERGLKKRNDSRQGFRIKGGNRLEATHQHIP